MKLTKKYLRKFIKEELAKVVEDEAHNPLAARNTLMRDLGAGEATLGAVAPEERKFIALLTTDQVNQAKALARDFDWFVQEFTPEQQKANGWPMAIIRHDWKEM